MGRERCLFCDRFIFDGDDTARPASLGVLVHRHCFVRDAGLDKNSVDTSPEPDPEDSDESDDR
jgi:hypothetical protein